MTSTGRKLFTLTKYVVYALLAVNVAQFFVEEFTGAAFVQGDQLGLADIIVAYTATIDTAAWLILLLILELETSVIPDEKLQGGIAWSLNTVSFACWLVIVYSFYGYVSTLGIPMGFEVYAGVNPCEVIGSGASFVVTLDEYAPLDAANCVTAATDGYFNSSLNMFASTDSLGLVNRLAYLDVLNAGIWLVIVVVLELEIFLQSSKLVGTWFFHVYKIAKVALYGILMFNTVYWWVLGQPLDAWDAFLWIFAFFFIEMNLLSWQEETAKTRAEREGP